MGIRVEDTFMAMGAGIVTERNTQDSNALHTSEHAIPGIGLSANIIGRYMPLLVWSSAANKHNKAMCNRNQGVDMGATFLAATDVSTSNLSTFFSLSSPVSAIPPMATIITRPSEVAFPFETISNVSAANQAIPSSYIPAVSVDFNSNNISSSLASEPSEDGFPDITPCNFLDYYNHMQVLKPTPDNGYQTIEGVNFLAAIQTVDEYSGQFWQQHRGPKALVYMPNYRPSTNSGQQAKAIASLISFIFCSPVNVAAPRFTDMGLGHVYPFFVSGLTNLQADILIRRKVWSTANLTFIAVPLSSFTTKYAMTIANLSLPTDHTGEEAVAQIMKRSMDNNEDLLQYIQNDFFIDPPLAKDILSDTVRSVNVKAMCIRKDGFVIEDSPYFRIYMKLPFIDAVRSQDFIRLLSHRDYASLNGTAICCPDFVCVYCIGRDHPISLCPLLILNQVYFDPFRLNFM